MAAAVRLVIRDERDLTPQKLAAEPAPERPAVPSPVWEQKPVAVLAVEFTFPTATAGEAAAYEPWTAASRWEQALVAKVQGFGGVVLQRSPSLLLVAFGMPQTLEQLPQRAVQAALALRHLVVEGTDREPCPELRLVGALGAAAGGWPGQRSHRAAPRPRGDARLAGAPVRSGGAGGDSALAGDGAAGRGVVRGAGA